ncbi:hypothetical protein OESDEN_04021 [Oesophagostomum dentatum]|uniref:Uncharacterized protein n=1 Tax=Oesophagostomum dentatum TaxID=61180 RepID=A0A0B1TJM6_OESDE|nr:hypothetical protein OESDEN_04021 [Oesophagostomum dentatum]
MRDASTIGKDLNELQQVVFSRRRSYLSFNSPVRIMGETERDTFDRDTKTALSQLELAIRRLTLEIGGALAGDEKELLSFVAESLHTYLKRIAKVVTDMRTIRIRNTASQQKMQRLHCLVEAKQRKDHERGGVVARSITQQSSLPPSILRHRHNRIEISERPARIVKENNDTIPTDDSHDGWDIVNTVPDVDVQSHDEDLSNLTSQEKTQLFAENERMLDRFSHVHAQIEGLETQITEIQRLQETFTEKVRTFPVENGGPNVERMPGDGKNRGYTYEYKK